MKLQLTKDKTIDLAMPWEKSPAAGPTRRGKGPSEVVGILLGDDDPRGCPAVRLQRRKDGVVVKALGFLPPPGALPKAWEELKRETAWELAPQFQAPQAALAACSGEQFIRQTTVDALSGELKLLSPLAATPKKKLGVRRSEDTGKIEKAAVMPEDKPQPFVPVSRNGLRSVMGPLAEEPFVLQTGLPEYQVLWLSRLLPEGRRPTACSVQTAPAALLSALWSQPAFQAADGTAVAVFVQRRSIYFAAYREGELVLFRECPGGIGSVAIHEQVRISLGVDDAIVDSFLEEGLVDPTPVLEPIMRPVLQQLQLSLDYLAQRHDVHVEHVFLLGLPSGAAFWSAFAKETIGLPFISPGVFEGLSLAEKGGVPAELASPVASQAFLAAYGAACAAMEVA